MGEVRDLSSARGARDDTVHHELALCIDRSATRVARHWAMRTVAAAGVGGTANQVVEVLTGELVDDAVRSCAPEADGIVRVRLRVDDDGVRVAVTGPAPLVPLQSTLTSLALVEVLSSAWGTGPQDDVGRTVWFDVATAG